jgi:predicted negative regulator of RcsB-dependent stress response
MVDLNLSEEEQVEALKKWWKENGRSMIVGVVLGLGAVFGWQAWNQHQQGVADEASARFEQLSLAVGAGNRESAAAQAESLIQDHKGSAYATFAALELAKIKLAAGDSAGAEAQLKWAMENGNDGSFRQIARLRLARLMFGAGRSEEAKAVLDKAGADSFQGEFAELRGDIARKEGDTDSARTAYREALDKGVSNASLVQMKLDDLTPTL